MPDTEMRDVEKTAFPNFSNYPFDWFALFSILIVVAIIAGIAWVADFIPTMPGYRDWVGFAFLLTYIPVTLRWERLRNGRKLKSYLHIALSAIIAALSTALAFYFVK